MDNANTGKAEATPASQLQEPLSAQANTNSNIQAAMPDDTPKMTVEASKKVIKAIKSEETGQIIQEGSNSKLIKSNIEDNKIVVKKKRIYRHFLKLIKQNKVYTSVLLADILGINRATVSDWFGTSQAQEILSKNINESVSKIKSSKDWKAAAYLIDKVTPKQPDTQVNTQINLEGLTIIRRDPNE